ncbi:MAG: PorV/PorQ family protein [candidate division Zixibacteria bacterium]
MPGKLLIRIVKGLVIAAVLLITGSMGVATLCHSQVRVTQANFLLEIPDARVRGLAGGGSVFSDGAVSAFYNPAGLISSGAFSAQIYYGEFLPNLADDLYFMSAYFSRSFGNLGAYGFSYGRLSYGKQDRISEGGIILETIEYYESSLALHGAIALNSSTSAGFGLKYINTNIIPWNIDKPRVSSFALDFGFLSKGHFPEATVKIDDVYYPTLRKYCRAGRDEGMIFSASLLNIGPEIEFTEGSSSNGPPPRSLRLAAGYQVLDSDYLGLRLSIDALKLLVNTDDGFSKELREITWSYGLEATILYIINLRAGRYLDDIGEQRYTSIGFGLGPEWCRFDYSRVLEGDYMHNRRGLETSYSLYCNIFPNIFDR